MGELTEFGFEISGTTTNRPDNVEEGFRYFNESLAQMQVYDGSSWLSVITTDSAGLVAAVSVTTLTAGAIVGLDASLDIAGIAGTATGNGGTISVTSGAGGATSGDSGTATLRSGNTIDGVSGSVEINTGNATGGTEDSGDVNIDVGSSSGGTPGVVNLGETNATAVNTGTYLGLLQTDTDGTVEGQIWYDASENKLKFFNGSTVETITSA